jgi:hypothetical protein
MDAIQDLLRAAIQNTFELQESQGEDPEDLEAQKLCLIRESRKKRALL